MRSMLIALLAASGIAHAASVDLSSSNFELLLVDLDLTDGTAPSVSVTEQDLTSFFTLGPQSSSFISGSLERQTELLFSFDLNYSLTTENLEGDYASLSWEVNSWVMPYAPQSLCLPTVMSYGGAPTIGTVRMVLDLINFGDEATQFQLYQAASSTEIPGTAQVSPVPEPETGVLVLAGLGVLAAVIHRRS